MGTLTVGQLTSRAAKVLLDNGHTQWGLSDLEAWATDAVRELCGYYPEACTKTMVIPLVAGTRQAVPAEVVVVTEFVRNMGADQSTPGRAVFTPPRAQMDSLDPDWHLAKASAVVVDVARGGSDTKTFYVYPPQPAQGRGSLEVVCAVAPPELVSADPVPVDDAWAPVLVNLILYRAYGTETEQSSVERASTYYQAAAAQIAARMGAEKPFRAGGGA